MRGITEGTNKTIVKLFYLCKLKKNYLDIIQCNNFGNLYSEFMSDCIMYNLYMQVI